jgi:hypothetical protein
MEIGERSIECAVVLVLLLILPAMRATAQESEITLFEPDGTAVAYVAMDDDMTIYSWSGKPLAYLESGSAGGGFNIYGFNGKHLGWFEDGVTRDHKGNGTCGIRDTVSAKLEPLKGLKQLKPLQSLTQLEPLRPIDSLKWSDTPCIVFLYEGAK